MLLSKINVKFLVRSLGANSAVTLSENNNKSLYYIHCLEVNTDENFVLEIRVPEQSNIINTGIFFTNEVNNPLNSPINWVTGNGRFSFTATFDGIDTVSIVSNQTNVLFNYFFSFNGINDSNQTTTYVLNPQTITTQIPITITHNLIENGYLINNDILVTAKVNIAVPYFVVNLKNNVTQEVSVSFILYPNQNNEVTFNISPILKSLFQSSEISNSNNFTITILASGTSVTITKTFIRGGKRTHKSNQRLANNNKLRLTDFIPMWTGYPITDYFLNIDYTISEIIIANITDIENKRSKGCNEKYIKFLNQKGGYSYWLFETHEETEKTKNLGGFFKNRLPNDLGNTSEITFKVASKVPEYYLQYMLDLSVSPEVYIYDNTEWIRVRNTSNSTTYNNIKKAYNVDFVFDIDNRFNPSLLWSN